MKAPTQSTRQSARKHHHSGTAISDVVILAAGRGKRMRSATPKPMQLLAGRPLLEHVLGVAVGSFPEAALHVVTSPTIEGICKERDYGFKINWVLQDEQLGTGHAVAQTLKHLNPGGIAMVLYADVPMVRSVTLETLAQIASQKALVLLTAEVDNPFGYGRIVRGSDHHVLNIVEEADADEQVRKICEVNTGIMAAPVDVLQAQLPHLSADNKQKEQYLTDLVALARKDGVPTHVHSTDTPFEILGVNSCAQLARVERVLQSYQAEQLMERGVRLGDPNRFDLRGSLRTGRDVFIDVGVLLEGDNNLGNGVQIGAYCILRDVHIEDGTVIKPHSVIENVRIGPDCQVGPYARLRPGTKLAKGVQIGNFVEIKQADIGKNSRVNHLSYVGDSVIAEDVNIGAGVITCNYDGKNKHTTRIGKGAFVGSNASLIAPVSIGERATVAAGSAINRDVPDRALGVARGLQKIRPNWRNEK